MSETTGLQLHTLQHQLDRSLPTPVQWGLAASEIVIIVSIVIAGTTVLLHSHRSPPATASADSASVPFPDVLDPMTVFNKIAY